MTETNPVEFLSAGEKNAQETSGHMQTSMQVGANKINIVACVHVYSPHTVYDSNQDGTRSCKCKVTAMELDSDVLPGVRLQVLNPTSLAKS